MKMKKTLATLALGASIVGLVGCSSNEVIVQMDSGNITKDEFYDALIASNGATVLESMIEEKLLRGAYTVSTEEVEAELEATKAQFESEEAFLEAVEAAGLVDEAYFKTQLELSLLQKKAITDGVVATDEQIEEYYEENKGNYTAMEARHILVEDEETAKKVKSLLDQGGDFAKLAKEYSTDTGTAENGGDIGEFFGGQMVEEFDEVVLSIDLNKISDPFKSTYGYHIVEVTKREVKELKDVKDEVKDAYLLEHGKSYYTAIDELKEKADYKIKDSKLKELLEGNEETGE